MVFEIKSIFDKPILKNWNYQTIIDYIDIGILNKKFINEIENVNNFGMTCDLWRNTFTHLSFLKVASHFIIKDHVNRIFKINCHILRNIQMKKNFHFSQGNYHKIYNQIISAIAAVNSFTQNLLHVSLYYLQLEKVTN